MLGWRSRLASEDSSVCWWPGTPPRWPQALAWPYFHSCGLNLSTPWQACLWQATVELKELGQGCWYLWASRPTACLVVLGGKGSAVLPHQCMGEEPRLKRCRLTQSHS